jgi:hypothetical protein
MKISNRENVIELREYQAKRQLQAAMHIPQQGAPTEETTLQLDLENIPIVHIVPLSEGYWHSFYDD